MTAEQIAIASFCVTLLMTLYVIGEKLFGGGNKLARAFSELEKRLTADITACREKSGQELLNMRTEFYNRVDLHNDNYRVGLEAITANIHALQLGLSEFRAKMAEDYMRRDSYYKASEELKKDFKERNDELKREVHDGFTRLESQISAVSQSIEAGRKSRNSA